MVLFVMQEGSSLMVVMRWSNTRSDTWDKEAEIGPKSLGWSTWAAFSSRCIEVIRDFRSKFSLDGSDMKLSAAGMRMNQTYHDLNDASPLQGMHHSCSRPN
jgi:hypothetical protein